MAAAVSPFRQSKTKHLLFPCYTEHLRLSTHAHTVHVYVHVHYPQPRYIWGAGLHPDTFVLPSDWRNVSDWKWNRKKGGQSNRYLPPVWILVCKCEWVHVCLCCRRRSCQAILVPVPRLLKHHRKALIQRQGRGKHQTLDVQLQFFKF